MKLNDRKKWERIQERHDDFVKNTLLKRRNFRDFPKEDLPEQYADWSLDFLKFAELDGKVLDIGAGPFAHFFEDRLQEIQYFGLDPKIKFANRKFPNVCGIGEYLPFKSRYFDHVLIKGTLDHVFDPSLVIEETHRILKKGGSCGLDRAIREMKQQRCG